MAYWPPLAPVGENFQDNFHNGYDWVDPSRSVRDWERNWPDNGYARSAPAEPPFVEYDYNSRGWYQGHNEMPRDFKSKKYWARPVDGKRKGAMGRLMDGLTGEGPDVFVVMNGDRRTLMRDMPHKPQWSRWKGFKWDPNYNQWRWDKDITHGETVHMKMPWTGARRGEKYNFYTREYEGNRERQKNHMQGRIWTDAHWDDDARRNDMNPLSFRTSPETYSTRVSPWAGLWAGGRPQRRF
ncbi:hypothetical protein LTR36_000753 [Oleoguttula mirabilis]|uniref:Uncharacterized protein n=1 Tax=Oleoguttula mirabilis TaxID=1507867 RepID=A0AAV9JQM7_9PEZI|nr:hypothetical protein LTR36_000753 [Oleoguttula mirabilis]